ncbi:MAG: hypothetical protein [Caudoviricetes sp.]|nr:MAG: hypothetical protein [Caudoviricetes sp.]
MIYTNEPANMYYVFVSAYRSYESVEVNELMQDALAKLINESPKMFGRIEDYRVTGCYHEVGSDSATEERTFKVLCTHEQAENLAFMATDRFFQDCVLVVNSQTHTANLWRITVPQYRVVREITDLNGSLQPVSKPTGECYSVIDGQYWEVI